jgi:hypothetical protein
LTDAVDLTVNAMVERVLRSHRFEGVETHDQLDMSHLDTAGRYRRE